MEGHENSPSVFGTTLINQQLANSDNIQEIDLLLTCPFRIRICRISIHPIINYLCTIGDTVHPKWWRFDSKIFDCSSGDILQSERDRTTVSVGSGTVLEVVPTCLYPDGNGEIKSEDDGRV